MNLFPTALLAQQDHGADTIPLGDALERGLLKARISGITDPSIHHDVIDGSGVHYGKCMQIIVRSGSDSLFHVQLDNGLVLIPADSALQDMIVTHDVVLPVPPDSRYISRFYAMCGQMHDAAPYLQVEYSVGAMADSTVQALTGYFHFNHIQNKAGQHALWAYTDQATLEDLTKYGADSVSLAITRTILDALHIPSNIWPLPTKEQNEEGFFILPKRVAYWSLGAVLVVLAVALYLIRRRNEPAANA